MSNGYLTSCALIISLMITIILFTKKTINSVETRTFKKILIFNVLESLSTTLIVVVALTSNSIPIFKILNRIDVNIIIWWCSFFLLYICHICKVKNIKIFNSIILVTNILFLILSLILDVNIIAQDGILDSNGPLTTLGFIGAVFYILLMLFVILTSLKNKPNIKKLIPFYFLIALLILVAFLRAIIPQINFISIMLTLVDLIMIFTIENPDVKMVDELVKNRKIIERTSEEKSIFLFKMSQELRGPISNIGREVQTYKNGKLNKSETDVVIDNIDNNNRKMNYLITDVLGINANDNMNIKILENTYNIYSLINEIDIRTRKLVKSEIDFNFACASNIPKELYGDSLKLKQVLMSVIINSIENTSSGYIHVDIDSITKYDLCRLVISVKDSGSGIDLLTINEILDQDIEISDKEYLKLDKLDVDLKIAYKIIKLLNGTMYVKSEVGKGTEVIITLNQYIKEDDEIKNNSLTQSYIQKRTNSVKVLIVNDDVKELKKIKTKLEEFGYETYTSLFGDDAINRIKNNEKYDLILIDDDMKLMSGISLLKELNNLGNNSRKIVLLEKDKISIGHHYIEDGFDAYIDKNKLSDEIDKKL